MDELKPCPFCNKPPITTPSGEGGKGLMIECLTVGCVNPHVSYYNHDVARTAWNTRPREGAGTVDQSIPMDPGPWRASDDGKDVFSEHFAVDAALRISGDFIDDHHRKDYAVWLARTLNNAALAAALPVLLGEPVGRVVDGFHDALGGSVHVAEWTGDEPPLGAILYTLPTQDTPNADQ